VTHAGRRDPFLSTTWVDEVTGTRGYLVIDRLANGVSSGGLRMRRGVTLDEVADLAYGMTVKEAVAHRPGLHRPLMGGAKGGIDHDPRDPGADDLLDRYVAAMRPLAAEYWSFGEDLGLRQEQVDRAAARAGLAGSLVAAHRLLAEPPERANARIEAAFAVLDDGISMGDLVGGLGVAQAALTALRRDGVDPATATAVVQGFGSIGGATARFLHRAGTRVVAISDSDGTVTDPSGLDVEALLRGRDRFGRMDRATLPAGAGTGPRDAWLDVAADVVVPAAVSYCVGPHEAARLQARWVVEGANLPVTEGGEAVLRHRGVGVLPDVVANSATNSWWWWVFFGDVRDPSSREESYALVRASMTSLVGELLDRSTADGVPPRDAALRIADERLGEAGS
jgi:glutamate dehydrogenase (NAD(P)+)